MKQLKVSRQAIQSKRNKRSQVAKLFLITGLWLMLLEGCAPKSAEQTITSTASDYYPIRQNTRYSYTGQGNEFASYVAYTDYTAPGKVQLRVDNGATTISEVIVIEENKVMRTYFDGSKQGRESFIDSTIQNDGEIILMDPIKKGTSWSLPDDSIRTITEIDVTITTSLNEYQAIEVKTQLNDQITKQYYAKGVGLVKVIYEMPEGNVSSELTGIDAQTSYSQFITFYFADIDSDAYHAITRQVTFQTNQSTREVLEATYRSIIEDQLHMMLTLNTHIEQISRYDENTMAVDLSDIYYQELSAGAGFEAKLIQSFVNTIGQYYGVSSVILTIGGQPYSSGHIYKDLNETFPVDLTNVIYE